MSKYRRLSIAATLAGFLLLSSTLALAQSNSAYQQQQRQQQQLQQQLQMQRQMDAQRQQQMRQQQLQRQQQMQQQQAQQQRQRQLQQQQQQAQQQRLQQMQQQRLQQMQQQQLLNAQRSKQQLQQSKQLADQKKYNDRLVFSNGLARINRPPTLGEMKRGFTGKVTSTGQAVVKVRGKMYSIPASRIGVKWRRQGANQQQQQQAVATRWNQQQQATIGTRAKTLAAANFAAKAKARIAAAGGGARGPGGNGGPPTNGLRAANDNIPLRLTQPKGGVTPVRAQPGTNGKVAVIGKSMDGGVKPYADALRREARTVEIFDGDRIPDSAKREFERLRNEYLPGRIPDDVLKESEMFKANQTWIEQMKQEGYTIIDVGNPNADSTSSPFYDMETRIVFQDKR